jgi:tetratricopeptide (TPR) repeat protein
LFWRWLNLALDILMIDQSKASQLARGAFEEWDAGRLEQSALLYEQAIRLADPLHFGLSIYYGEYACVLNELGNHEKATEQLDLSLAVELAQGNTEGSIGIITERYFLANQQFLYVSPERALETLAPSIASAPNDWLTRLLQAHILFALQRNIEAKTAAVLAIENAPTREKAEELRHGLKQILGAPDV